MIAREIEPDLPRSGRGGVLRGGDHGAKIGGAERRFRQRTAPRVLVCTAAGREGINLQFARASCSTSTCRGTRWMWNSASGASIATARGRPHGAGLQPVLSDTIEGRIS